MLAVKLTRLTVNSINKIPDKNKVNFHLIDFIIFSHFVIYIYIYIYNINIYIVYIYYIYSIYIYILHIYIYL